MANEKGTDILKDCDVVKEVHLKPEQLPSFVPLRSADSSQVEMLGGWSKPVNFGS